MAEVIAGRSRGEKVAGRRMEDGCAGPVVHERILRRWRRGPRVMALLVGLKRRTAGGGSSGFWGGGRVEGWSRGRWETGDRKTVVGRGGCGRGARGGYGGGAGSAVCMLG